MPFTRYNETEVIFLKNGSISKASKIMIIVLCITATLLIITTALDQAGYKLLLPEFNLLGSVVMLVLLLTWLAIVIYRKVQKKTYKTVVALVMAFIIMFIGMMLASLILQFGQYALPHSYATIASSGGSKALLTKQLDISASTEEELAAITERMDIRQAALLAQSEEAEAAEDSTEEADAGETAEETVEETTEEIVEETTEDSTEEETAEEDSEEDDEDSETYLYGAYGYVYRAYPKMLWVFYNENADSEGAIYLGAESEARIMYEWQDDDTLRIYIEDAEPGDEGEILLHFN